MKLWEAVVGALAGGIAGIVIAMVSLSSSSDTMALAGPTIFTNAAIGGVVGAIVGAIFSLLSKSRV